MENKQSRPSTAVTNPKATTSAEATGKTAATSKSKGGRPKKAAEEKRSKAIQIRLSPANYRYVQKLAEDRNTSLSEAILDQCKGDVKVLTPEQEAQLRNIATMANHLNQLARKANTDGFQSVAVLVKQQAEKLKELLTYYSK